MFGLRVCVGKWYKQKTLNSYLFASDWEVNGSVLGAGNR